MKRIIAFAVLVFAIVFGGVATVNAQSKELKKDVKKRVKQLKKEGWTLSGSTQTLDYALLKYRTYLEEDTENRVEIVGIALGKNPKVGRDNAVISGISNYAARAKAQVVGKLKSLASSNASDEDVQEIDRFGAAYETGVNAKLSGLVKQHFVLVRTLDNGSKEFNVFMSLDEKKAKEAREKAALEAKQKAELKDLSSQVEEFIGEPVSAE